MRRLLLVACLLGCVPPSVEDTPATLIPTAEDLGAAPSLPAAGWLQTDGPIDLAHLDSRDEPAPDPLEIWAIEVDADNERLQRVLCEAPSDQLRDHLWQSVSEEAARYGDLDVSEPGVCYGPAWCDWAFRTIQPTPTTYAQAELEARLSRCPSERIGQWLNQRDAYVASNKLLFSLSEGGVLTPLVLDQLIARLHQGEEIYMGVVLRDAWGTFDPDAVRSRILQAREEALETGVRNALGHGLGLFDDPEAVAAWRLSCGDANRYGCEARGEAPLMTGEDLGQRLTSIAGRIGRYGLPAILSQAATAGIDREEIVSGLVFCMDQDEDPEAAGTCFDELMRFAPDAVDAAIEDRLTEGRPYWPQLRRRIRAAQLGHAALDEVMTEAGLKPQLPPLPRRMRGTDPVHLLAALGRSAPVYQIDAPLDRIALLRRMLTLVEIPAIVQLPEDDPYRPVIWFEGRRHTTTLPRSADPESVNASELAAVVNAVAQAHDRPLRLIVQPAHTRFVQTYVVAATPKAIASGIRAGLLSPPVPDTSGWARARAYEQGLK